MIKIIIVHAYFSAFPSSDNLQIKIVMFPTAGHIESHSGTHNKCVRILLALLLNILNIPQVRLFTVSSQL